MRVSSSAAVDDLLASETQLRGIHTTDIETRPPSNDKITPTREDAGQNSNHLPLVVEQATATEVDLRGVDFNFDHLATAFNTESENTSTIPFVPATTEDVTTASDIQSLPELVFQSLVGFQDPFESEPAPGFSHSWMNRGSVNQM